MERFSYIGDVGFGGDERYGTFFVPWPGLRLVQGFRKGFSGKEPRGEAGDGGLQFGGLEYLLFCDSSLGYPEYFRSEEGDSSS